MIPNLFQKNSKKPESLDELDEIKVRLKKIQSLLDQEMISQDEYESLRRKALGL